MPRCCGQLDCEEDATGGGWGALEGPYEVRSVAGVNYLLHADVEVEGLSLYVEAPSSLILPSAAEDPCANVPVQTCVIR